MLTNSLLQTVIALLTFYLAMVLNPEVLKKAQEEVDRVVGNGRLPSFADRPNLPYIDAVLKETLRWEVVLQTGTLTFCPSSCYIALVVLKLG